jgi:hypothetical protein
MPWRKPRTHRASDLSLAYQVFGDGPIELFFVGPMVSHVELSWTMPEFKAFFEQLATFCRVALFDKAGLGLSDPVRKVRTLDDRAAEIEAVMDRYALLDFRVHNRRRGCHGGVRSGAARPIPREHRRHRRLQPYLEGRPDQRTQRRLRPTR